jgi:tetratricopeptide (TPR) repeat protein
MKSLLMASAVLLFGAAVSAQQIMNVSDHDVPRPQTQGQSTASTTAPQQERMDQASLFMVKKQYAEAAEIYQQLLKENPKDASLWNRLGIAYQHLGEPDNNYLREALKAYEKASKLNKDDAPIWNNMGTVYFGQKKYSKAIRFYQKALDLDQTNATFFSNIGMAYLDTKKFDLAMTAFHNALALDPEVFTHTGTTGTVLQDRTISDHGLFYFVIAKSFATEGNAERCVFYLKKSRDEGYADLAKAKDDPGFSRVINDPSFRDIVGLPALPAVQPKSQGL